MTLERKKKKRWKKRRIKTRRIKIRPIRTRRIKIRTRPKEKRGQSKIVLQFMEVKTRRLIRNKN
jgi:hypothetical protein